MLPPHVDAYARGVDIVSRCCEQTAVRLPPRKRLAVHPSFPAAHDAAPPGAKGPSRSLGRHQDYRMDDLSRAMAA